MPSEQPSPTPFELPFFQRLLLSVVCFWRVLRSGRFAASVQRLEAAGDPMPLASAVTAGALPEGLANEPAPLPEPSVAPQPVRQEDVALQLLALLQRQGRLIDFLEQDLTAFADADVGLAARVVHEGCRRALRAHAKLGPVLLGDEGARVTVDGDRGPDEVKLTGNVQGKAPFTGTLRHRGWRVSDFALPRPVRAYDASVLAPAEVEL